MPFEVVDNDLDAWIAYEYHPVKYESHKLTMSLKEAMFHFSEEDPNVEPKSPQSVRSPGSPKREG